MANARSGIRINPRGAFGSIALRLTGEQRPLIVDRRTSGAASGYGAAGALLIILLWI
jgi:hypothetical protein